MNLITRDTDYAIRSLCCIAKKKKALVSVNELVAELKIPRPFLRKILQILNKKGILRSYKGKGGGFILKKPLSKISVGDMIRIFQGPVKLQEHLFKGHICPSIKRCALKKKIDAIERHVVSELSSISLSSL